jgi:hypothetical protein
MAQTDTRSLQQIKQETEQTRAGLTAIVEQLRGGVTETATEIRAGLTETAAQLRSGMTDTASEIRAGLTETVAQLRSGVTETASEIRERISPAAINSEVSDYIRTRGEQLMDDITVAARKNPMQAVAVGAGLAYPLFRIARAIPLPIWMIGAGLYLAGSHSGKTASQKTSDLAADLSGGVVDHARGLRDQLGKAGASATESTAGQVNQAVSAGTEQARHATDTARATLAAGSERVRETAGSVGASVREGGAALKEHATRMAEAAGEDVRDFADNAASTGQRLTWVAKDSAVEAARSTREIASNLGDRTSKTLGETIEQHPLLVAGVGLVIGGVIASALPRTEYEDELVGTTSTSVKRRAQTAASRGLEAAKGAGEALQRATEQAEAEGISPEGLSEGARDLGHRVRRVAEAAVTTAFEPPEDKQQSGCQGENDHG